MNEPTVTISLREFNELKAALTAAIVFRTDQIRDKGDYRFKEWMRDLDVWSDMKMDYERGMK